MATELKDRIKTGLDETRMIVLVVQVLIGFGFRGAFEPRCTQLPPTAQILKLVSLALLIVALAMLLAVPAYHRIASNGHNTVTCEGVLKRLLWTALLPFAAALGIDVALAAFVLLGPVGALAVGTGTAGLALFCWYGVEEIRRRSHPPHAKQNMNEETKPTPLDEKIKQLLTECRIVLPGTQAFLGFQLSAFLTEAFAKLSRPDQLTHLAALILVAISGILLMTAPAYHRIAEEGQMTRHFLRLGSRLLLAAMIPLAFGISLDFYVVISKVTAQPVLAFVCAALACATFAGFWFVFPLLRRGESSGRRTSEQAVAHAS